MAKECIGRLLTTVQCCFKGALRCKYNAMQCNALVGSPVGIGGLLSPVQCCLEGALRCKYSALLDFSPLYNNAV